MRSSHSVQHPHASRNSPYPPAANPAYPVGHRPYRGDDPTVEATNRHYQKSLEMSNPSLYPTVSNSQGNSQLPYARDPSTLSLVPSRVPPETSGPSTRERTDVRQLEASNRMYGCTSSSPIEERNELGYGAKVNIGGMGFELWLVHALFTMYHFSIIDSSPRYKSNKQTTHSGRRDSARSESRSRGR